MQLRSLVLVVRDIRTAVYDVSFTACNVSSRLLRYKNGHLDKIFFFVKVKSNVELDK